MQGWLWVLVGLVAAVLFTLLLAYLLHQQRLHTQIDMLKRALRHTRSPWAREDAAWKHLGEAVEQIPQDLRPPEEP